jgi:hypothetical protein
MSYKIGVSSGWWSIARSEELLGIASKIGSVATYGVNFVQVDFESIAEFQEPEVIKKIKRLVDTLQVDWGMHGEIGEMMALESALEVFWKHSHRRLHQYLDTIYLKFWIEGDYREYIPKYIVFHASNTLTIAMIVERYRYAGQMTVTPFGDVNWIEFINRNKKLKEWVEKSNLLYFLIGKESGLGFVSVEDIKKKIYEKIGEEVMKEGESLKEELEKEVETHRHAWEFFREITKLRFAEGAITYEDIAYLIVARYLFEERNNPNEPLWNLFFPNYSTENGWEKLEEDLMGKEVKFLNIERGEVRLPPQIVALVAARYILGHFTERNKEEFIAEEKRQLERILPKDKLKEIEENFLKKTPFEKLAILNNLISEKVGKGERKFMILFENPELKAVGEEGLQRLIHAVDIYKMVKAAEKIAKDVYIGMVFDQEHYLHNNLDPMNEIKSLKSEASDLGKFLLVFHVGAPKPYHPAHEPIDIGSEAQFWIYKYAYELRKLGFGVGENEGIFIFERGGARGQTPAQFIGQSAAALRIIVEYLEKNVEPEKLPPEFYGISPREILAEERQLAIIREHFFDPLKGLLQVPEEEYTFLGSKAIEKGKRPEEWKKEEMR